MTLATLGEKLFMNSEYKNALLVCENEEIPVIREILSAASSYFKKVLSENNSEKVSITETTVKLFKEIIRYVYLGHINTLDWSMKDVLELLALARNYQYDEVVSQVVIHLEERQLDFDTWDLLHSAATFHNLETLEAKCGSFSEGKISEFMNLQNLEKFKASFIEKMFESAKIQSCNQDELLEALLEWKEIHSGDEIKNVLTEINWKKVSLTILATIASDYFKQIPNIDDCTFWKAVSENRTKRKEKSGRTAKNDLICPVTTAASTLFGVQQGDSLFSSTIAASRFNFVAPKGWSTSFSGTQKPTILPTTAVAGFDFDKLTKFPFPEKAESSFLSSLKPEKDIPGTAPEFNTEKLHDDVPPSIKEEPECIIKLEEVSFMKNMDKKFTLSKYQCTLVGRLHSNYIRFLFQKNDSEHEIPMKRIEWESSENYVLYPVYSKDIKYLTTALIVSQPKASNNCFKFSVDLTDAKAVHKLIICSQQFVEMSEIRLRNLVIS